jgi:hypothetical protein
MALDLADCHATRIEAQDLVVDTVEPRLSFRDQLRLEAANAVARDGNLDLAIVGQDRLRTRPIAAVATASTVGIALFISQVLSEFCAERPLDQRLLELLEEPILACEILGLGIVGK